MGNLNLTFDKISTLSEQELAYYRQKLWQQQLLHEIGVKSWVSQATPVINVDISVAQFFAQPNFSHNQANLNEPNLNEPNLNEISLENSSAEQTAQSLPAIGSSNDYVSNNYVSNDYVKSEMALSYPHTSDESSIDYLETVNLDKTSEVNEKPLVIVKKLRLQVMAYQDWLIMVDESSFDNRNREQILWQQIALSLQSSIHQFTFPLLSIEHLSNNDQTMMATLDIAMAAFDGFIFSITKTNQSKLAILTNLPSYFDNLIITPFPTLTQMLENFDDKRKFWQALNN